MNDDRGHPPRDLHARSFAALLRLLPRAFRDVHGDEMAEFFARRVARARALGASSELRLWLVTLYDLFRTAAAEHLRPSVRPATVPRRGEIMSSLVYDLRHAARHLRHSPFFTASAVLLLTVGIGLNATVFNLVDTLLYRPPPFANPERLVHIYQDADDGNPGSTAFPAYRDIAAHTDVFADVAAVSTDGAIWETADGARPVAVTYATASYLRVLGLAPFAGRWFDPEHDRVGSGMVAVISHRSWKGQLGADPGVLGSTIRLNNQLVTIIGIGPERFNGEAGALVTDFWLSISSAPVGGSGRVANLDRREDHWYQIKGRLAPGVTVEQAGAAMRAAAQRMSELYPAIDRGRGITVFAHDEVRFHPDADRALIGVNVGLMVVAGLVLLLACTNLANLLLARGMSRSSEIAVREALGASRARVMRLLMLEALLLASIGGAAGLTAGAWAMRVLPTLPIPTPGGTLDTGFDTRVLVFGVILTLLTGLVFGLLPATRSTRSGIASMLRDEARGRTAGRKRSLLRGILVAVQVAVSMVLVIGAGLLVRSLANAQRVDPGFQAAHIAVIGTNLRQGGVSAAETNVVLAQLLERVEGLPGVEAAALTTRVPVSSGGRTTQEISGYQPATGVGAVELPFAYVSRGYFETMGIRMVAGRGFASEDRVGTPRVAIVNAAAARQYWNGDAVGGRIRSQGAGDSAWVEVIGVVGDVKVTALQEPPTAMIYYSVDQASVGVVSVVARSARDPALILSALRQALRDVRSTLPVTRLMTMEAHLGRALAQPRLAALLLGAFSLLGLLIASLGVYAVVSFTVERRTQELGIRAALGASDGRIMRMVVGESLATVGVGVSAGLLLAFIAARGLRGVLFGVTTADLATFAAATTLMLVTAGIASFLPARRAVRADPVASLRSQ